MASQPDEVPVAPRVLSPYGVYEDTCWAICGGFALKAIDGDGRCVGFAVVHTLREYEAEGERLWDILRSRDDAGRAEILQRAATTRRGTSWKRRGPLLVP